MSKIAVFAALVVFGLSTSSAESKTWTSVDGNSIEADFVSATGTHVTIRRTKDGRRFTLPLEKLSDADREWVVAEAAGGESGAPNLPETVGQLVEARGTLLFEDNFDREDSDEKDDLGENWTTNSASRAMGDKQNDLVDGKLVMTISPRADHAISTVHSTSEPYKDAVFYLKMKLEEGEQLKLAYNDKQEKSVWAGHINGAIISPTKLVLSDEREGRFKLEYRDTKDTPAGKAALAEVLKSTDKSFPLDLKTGEWHEVVTLHQGDTLTVFIDGEEVGSHTSPGFGHATKRQLAFAVAKGAVVDDLKIWKLGETVE